MAAKQRNPDDLKSRLDAAFSRAGRKVETAGKRVERSLEEKGLDKDAEKIISYLNDEVVPAIRTHSTQALRTAARTLAQFADYMERRQQ